MTTGSILLGVALLIAVATYLTYPFWGAPEQTRRVRQSKSDLLHDQKEAILAQIRVLDFDFETSKLPEGAYNAQRAQLLAEATAVLQQLDALTGGPASDDALEAAIARARQPQPASPDDLDSAIEAAIARARKKSPAAVPAAAPAAAPVAVPAATNATNAPAPTAVANGRPARFCPQCGSPVQAADKFCVACGHKLAA